MLADKLSRTFIVDPDLRLLRPVGGKDGIDRHHRDAGRIGCHDRRHDAVRVDGHHDDALHPLLDIGLDRVVLGDGIVVGIENDQIDTGGVGCLLRAFVHLGEKQRLLVDLDQGEGRLVLRLHHAGGEAESEKTGGTDEGSAF